MIDGGRVGRIVTGTATIFSHGMEHWHPDPNFFGGTIEVSDHGGRWRKTDCSDLAFGSPNWPAVKPKHANYRGAGLADLASSILHGTAHHTSAAAGQHVLEVMCAILESGRTARFIELAPSTRPPALNEDEARRLV